MQPTDKPTNPPAHQPTGQPTNQPTNDQTSNQHPQVYEVQEEFTYGLSLELARARGADRVAGGGKKTLDAVAARLSTAQSKVRRGAPTRRNRHHHYLRGADRVAGGG